jgi:uncharacterized protein (TIGR00251 family)
MPLAIAEFAGGIEITVKVVPGSSRTALAGELGDMLKVKVAAAPEKGKANECLVDFLAQKLGIKNGDISLISGMTNPVKRLMIKTITRQEFLNKIR